MSELSSATYRARDAEHTTHGMEAISVQPFSADCATDQVLNRTTGRKCGKPKPHAAGQVNLLGSGQNAPPRLVGASQPVGAVVRRGALFQRLRQVHRTVESIGKHGRIGIGECERGNICFETNPINQVRRCLCDVTGTGCSAHVKLQCTVR